MEHFNHASLPVPSDVTLARGTIHAPEDIRHFMKIKGVTKRVIVRAGASPLADTRRSLRLLEVGHDMYTPALYIPREDVLAPLSQVAGKSTHCPLKGDAVYFRLADGGPEAPDIAWSYPDPFGFAAAIAGYIAFDGDRVTVEEIGDMG